MGGTGVCERTGARAGCIAAQPFIRVRRLVFVQVPGLAVSVCPSRAFPETTGASRSKAERWSGPQIQSR